MKKENKPVMTEKDKKVKNMLMQTYLTSLLCLVLCVTMFFGTSYAWFTSEVSSTQNEIYIGILDVDLTKTGKNGKVNLAGGDNQVFDKNVRWEPGYTMLENITVTNGGDLAFNYELHFTDGKLKEDSKLKLEEVAKLFDVWVHDDKNGRPNPDTYKDITDGNGWKKAGTLEDLLSGKAVLKGTMEEVRGQTNEPNPDTTDGIATEHSYTIALHMREDATSSVQGQKITLNVKLIAYQLVSESDSMASSYDAGITTVSNAEELKTALAKGGSYLMTANISLSGEENLVIPKNVSLDGNGNTLTYTKATDKDVAVEVAGGTVSNMTITAPSVKVTGGAVSGCELPTVSVSNPTANVEFLGCTFGIDLILSSLGTKTVTLSNCGIRSLTDADAVFSMQGDSVVCDNQALTVSEYGVVLMK